MLVLEAADADVDLGMADTDVAMPVGKATHTVAALVETMSTHGTVVIRSTEGRAGAVGDPLATHPLNGTGGVIVTGRALEGLGPDAAGRNAEDQCYEGRMDPAWDGVAHPRMSAPARRRRSRVGPWSSPDRRPAPPGGYPSAHPE